MSWNFPRRPPRKNVDPSGRDTNSAGLLVNVVRTLTTSASSDQKEFEKQKLQNGFKETGKAIDSLVAAHQSDLSSSLQTFRKVSTRITATRERVRNVKNSVSSCKALLQCKRDELQKLWMENAEQKHITNLLEQVERIRKVPEDAKEAANKKHFLKASQLLLGAHVSLEGDLIVVDGLRDMKEEIRRKNEGIYETIIEEIHRLLYLRPTEELMVDFQKGRDVGLRSNSSSLASCINAREDDEPILQDNGCAFEDTEDTLPQPNPIQHLAVLFEALGVLGKVPQALDNIKHRIQLGLTRMVHNTTMAYYEQQLRALGEEEGGGGGGGEGAKTTGDSRNLSELVQLLFRQFKVVVVLHTLLLSQLKRIRDTRHIADVDLYEVEDVWGQIQMSLQHLLSDYLDVQNLQSGIQTTTAAVVNNSLSAYFTKKRPPRHKRPSLFRFDATAHALNVSAFAKEQKSHEVGFVLTLSTPREAEHHWICVPSPHNVTGVFRPVMRFASEIEKVLGVEGGCRVRNFLEEYVRDTFLPRAETELRDKADTALQSSDAWHTVVGTEEQRRLEAPVPVLASSARTLDLCRLVESQMQALPSFAGRLAALWLLVLGEYQRRIQGVYEEATRSIRQTEGAEAVEYRKISATWAVDEDISRLLKSLPNWLTLVQSPSHAFPPANTPFSPPTAPPTPMVESAEEIRSRNQRESEILMGNLGSQKKIAEWEIILNIGHIRSLANIHESLEWFSAAVRRLLGDLPPSIQEKLSRAEVVITNSASDQSPIQEALSLGFQRHLAELEEMAATCLLMLHLEIRVHCFYHLLPLARQSSHIFGARESQEPDSSVLALNRDLVQLHELLASQLQSRKVRYVFEGLGHLVSEIFIHSTQSIAKINDNGKKRMCRNIFALQQCLSSLTGSREPDLDVARKFFQLLNRTPEEILSSIVETGAEFGELEYRYLLALTIRSHTVLSTQHGALENAISRLRDIMAERKK